MKTRFTFILAVVTAFLVGSLLGNYLLYRNNRDLEGKNAGLTEEIDGLKKKIDSLDKTIGDLKKNPRTGAPPRNMAARNRRPHSRDLKYQRAQQSEVPAVEETVAEPSTNRMDRFRPFGPPSAAEMRARFEEMRERDPERYAQITNNMARWQARRQERLQNQFDILASADTTHMTKEQRKVHETYQDLLVRQEELREMMNPNNADVTDEQREAAFGEMRDIGRQLHDLQRTERDTLLTQTANALGYQGDDAKEVVNAIKGVYEATGGGHHGGPPGPGGPGGRGGRGGWGRR